MSEWGNIEEELAHLCAEDEFYGYSNISSWLSEQAKKLESGKLKEELELYSKICFMMLIPTSMNEPLKERINFFEHGRSARPEDLTEVEIEKLESTYEGLNNPWLKARLAEILWLRKKPKNINWIQTAIDCYLSLQETKENWFKDVGNCHERAFYLGTKFRRNPNINIDIEKMRGIKIGIILNEYQAENFTVLKMGELLVNYGMIENYETQLIEKYLELAESCKNINIHLADGYLKAVIHIYEQLKQFEKVSEIIMQRTKLYEKEGDGHLKKQIIGAVLAQDAYEKALQILATIQRKFRGKFQYAQIEQNLYEKMHEAAVVFLETAPQITHKIDIKDIIDWVSTEISGQDFPIALHKFLSIKPIVKLDDLQEKVFEKIKNNFLSNLFGEKYFSGDARVIKRSSAMSTNEFTDEQLEVKMIEECKSDVEFWTKSALIEGFKVLQREHNLRLEDFFHLTQLSPFIPQDRSRDIAKGLYFGYDGDFLTSLHLLAPQIEHIVRYHLKNSDVRTTTLEDGIETELSLSALLKKEEAKKVFNEGLIIELKTIFTHPSGFNIRNDVAHGLVSSDDYNQVGFFYAWYFLLRITFMHFCRKVQSLDEDDFQNLVKNPL
ncbi:DUF4209 domain-containing protein [Acinetobacter haemolyticus]|uniref:DUF4209 domain-containing protein n=1 Tax=Acinetobacter haemolyticus TaxID=29430 RepID=UPI000DE844FF|nr:DUF4209 domain-containing protein [Acinetobacter haemolyticus]WHR57040.1 DUF4209 domain-containing protein [Acinetobacter haemolyticus]